MSESNSDPKKHKNTLNLNDRMLIVARIRELKDKGTPTRAIADALASEGFRFSNGNPITAEYIAIWQREYLKQGSLALPESRAPKGTVPHEFTVVLSCQLSDTDKVRVLKAMAGVR